MNHHVDRTGESEGSAAGDGSSQLIAAEPFNRSDADIIFRVSDGTDFYLHKQILTISSSVLDKIIKGAISQNEDGITVATPIICVSETSKTLDSLLRYCYPALDPELENLDSIRDVLAAATKYGIRVAIPPLKGHLRRFVTKEPVRVYAIACRNDMRDVAQEAANVAVGGRFLERDYPELELIPADVYWHLLVYYRDFKTPNCHLSWRRITTMDTKHPAPPTFRASLPFNDADADVIIQSTDGVQFRLHKLILSKASSFFREMFTLPQESAREGEIPIIPVSESGQTLDHLFRLVYPIGDEPKSRDLGVIYDVLTAAIKYDMHRPVSVLKLILTARIRQAPVGVFLIACRYKLSDIARAAAQQTVQRPILERNTAVSGSVSDTEVIDPRVDVPASVLYRIIKFRLDFVQMVSRRTGWDVVISEGEQWSTIKKVTEPRFCRNSRCESREFELGNQKWVVPMWLDEYADKAKSTLKSGAKLGTASDDSMLDQALIRAGKCDTCSERASAVLRAYREFLSEQISKRLSEIIIDTSYDV